MAKNTNWKAIQLTGTKKDEKKILFGTDVKTKYMSMGSWRGSLSDDGKYRGKK
jgi:hypothetical protein